jgi:hypothetical protein
MPTDFLSFLPSFWYHSWARLRIFFELSRTILWHFLVDLSLKDLKEKIAWLWEKRTDVCLMTLFPIEIIHASLHATINLPGSTQNNNWTRQTVINQSATEHRGVQQYVFGTMQMEGAMYSTKQNALYCAYEIDFGINVIITINDSSCCMLRRICCMFFSQYFFVITLISIS